MKNWVSPNWQFLKEKQHIWKLIWFSVKSFHNTCFFRNYKKIKQACCSGKKMLAGYSSSISGQIPMGCTAGWFILDCTFDQPKEETKLQYCPTPQDQTMYRSMFCEYYIIHYLFPIKSMFAKCEGKTKPINSFREYHSYMPKCGMHYALE